MRAAQDRAVFAQMSRCKFFHFMKIFFKKNENVPKFLHFFENFFRVLKIVSVCVTVFIKMKIVSKKYFFLSFCFREMKKFFMKCNSLSF